MLSLFGIALFAVRDRFAGLICSGGRYGEAAVGSIPGRPQVLSIGLAGLMLGYAGCIRTHAYPGAERSPDETALVFFYAGPHVELSQMAVDGIVQGVFDTGIQVLPGERRVTAAFELSDPFSCSTREYCLVRRWTGRCFANLRASAGERYAVRIDGHSEAPSIFISLDDDENEIKGSGSCQTQDSDLVPVRR